MDEPIKEIEVQPIIEPQEIPPKQFDTIEERNKSIINAYKQGMLIKDIALSHNISEPRIYQLVKSMANIVSMDREQEKARRMRRLRLCENKASPKLAPKTATELVNILKAQKDELEPDSNTVNIDNRQIHIMQNDAELNESIKSINAMFQKLLSEPKK